MTEGSSEKSGSSQVVRDAAVPPRFNVDGKIAAAFFLYAALLLLLTWKHTFWRDESEVWLVARSSSTLRELLRNTRYEGHPPLWYLVQYGLTRFTSNVEWMKFPNFLFSIVAAFLLLTAKQLRMWVRLGLVFSYYMMFEYGTIARNYMIGIMLLVAATRLIGDRAKAGVYVPMLLSLAALTSLPALVVSAFLGLLYLWWVWRETPRRTLAGYRDALGTAAIFGILVYCACAVGAAAMVRPPADSGLLLDSASVPGLLQKIGRCGQFMLKAYFPNPQWQPKFWNTIVWDALKFHVGTVLGLSLIVPLTLLFREQSVRCFFAAASGMELAQMLVSGRAFQRHTGWLFVIFMMALLLDQSPRSMGLRPEDAPPSAASVQWRTTLLAAILLAQAAASYVAIYFSLRFPFSESRQVALFLKERRLDRTPLAFEPYYASQSVLAYLPHSSGYNLERHTQVPFLVWDRREFLERRDVPMRDDLQAAARNGEAPVLITEKRLGPGDLSRLHVGLLAAFEDASCPQDRYYVYR